MAPAAPLAVPHVPRGKGSPRGQRKVTEAQASSGDVAPSRASWAPDAGPARPTAESSCGPTPNTLPKSRNSGLFLVLRTKDKMWKRHHTVEHGF